MGGRRRDDGRMMGRRERGEGILKTFQRSTKQDREEETTRRREIHTRDGGFMECNRSGRTVHQSLLNRS